MEPVTEEDLKDMFDMLDVDRSSALRLEELANGLRALGLNPSESQIESLCRKADDRSGRTPGSWLDRNGGWRDGGGRELPLLPKQTGIGFRVKLRC